LLALFGLALIPTGRALMAVPIVIAAGACAYAGKYRSWARVLLTVSVTFIHPDRLNLYLPPEIRPRAGLNGLLDAVLAVWPMLATVLLLCLFAMYLFRRFRHAAFARHPVICVHVFFAGFLLLACSGLLKGTPQVLLWTFLAVFGAYFWFLCYALVDQRSKDGDSPLLQLGVFHPFWGSSTTPIGKGAAYLRKVEAKDPRELAVTQLKGLKLLLWVLVLSFLNYLLDYVSRSVFHVPGLQEAIAKNVIGQPYPWYVCWASLIQKFFRDMLTMATFFGPMVAVARLAGYRLLRNTRRPLSSTTLVEFWNRYYYYYKELLVEFFFFPTFLRCFKKHGRLRIFFATFMAATVGNFIFHFIRDIRYTAEFGLAHQLFGFQTFAFYCVVLGVGIGISQMRVHRHKTSQLAVHKRLSSTAGVLCFYCVLSIFSSTFSDYTLGDHFSFLFHVLGFGSWN